MGILVTAVIGVVCARQVQVGSVSGKIVDAKGSPLPGIRVRAVPQGGYVPNSDEAIRSGHPELGVLTDQNGQYRLGALRKGFSRGRFFGWLPQDYEVVVQGEGYAPQRARVHVREGNVTDLDFILEREAGLSGRIVDTRGRPCGGREVRLVREGTLRADAPFVVQALMPRGYRLTDAEGRFDFEHLSPGRYGVEVVVFVWGSVIAQRAGVDSIELRSGESVAGVDFPIEAPEDWGAIDGEVVDAWSGEVVEEFGLRVMRVERGGEGGALLGRYERDGNKIPFVDTGPYHDPPGFHGGEFRITDLSPGVAILEVTALRYATTSVGVEVAAGRRTRAVVRMRRESLIRGQVGLSAGSTLGSVSLYESESGAGEPKVVYGGAAGTWCFSQLASGRFLLRAEVVEEGRVGTIRRFDWAEVDLVEEEEERVGFDFRMGDRSCGLRVQFRGLGGGWSPFVVVNEEGSWDLRPDIRRIRATAYRFENTVEITGLPAGRYEVRGQRRPHKGESRRSPAGEQIRAVTLAPGVVEQVEFRFR